MAELSVMDRINMILSGIAEHFDPLVDFVLFGQTDNFFGVLFKDIDFRTDIHFAVFPADTFWTTVFVVI